MNTNNYTYITTAATTVIGPVGGPRRISLAGIAFNKTSTGTVTILAGAVVIGILAVGQTVGTRWNVDKGIEIQDLQITTSAAEDLTIFWNNVG